MKEEQAVESERDLSLRINRISKTYSPICCGQQTNAVNNLSLAVGKDEKFGLLGYNGGGKSTTFKTIVGDIYPDYGSIKVFDQDIQGNQDYLKRVMGYCPQQHALFEFMTVRETIEFYASYKKMHLSTEQVLEDFNLHKYRDTYNTNLSGGNKRKLNFCIALMFFPKIALLDEPTTGVDADARKTIWKIINSLGLKTEFSMLLTTHTMEEAESLCDRVGWLSRGNFICVGSPEELKMRYSQGYKLEVSFNTINKPSGLSAEEINTQLGSLNSILNLNDYLQQTEHEKANQQNLFCLKEFLDRTSNCFTAVKFDRYDNGINYLSLSLNQENKSKFYAELIGMNRQGDLIDMLNFGLEKLDDIFMRFG